MGLQKPNGALMSSGEADGYYASKSYECRHSNTANHFDNPRRFTCLNCKKRFVDFGNGYEEDKSFGLASESVPYPHETKGYWYTQYQKLREDILRYGIPPDALMNPDFGDANKNLYNWWHEKWAPVVRRVRDNK